MRILPILLLVCTPLSAQRRVTVYDMEARTPLAGVSILVDRRETLHTRYDGTFLLPDGADTVIVASAKHVPRHIAVRLVRDSIGLLPMAHTLGEVVVYGEDKSKRLQGNLDTWIRQYTAGLPRPTGHDFVGWTDFRGKARAKRRRRVQAALDTLAGKHDDPIIRAYREEKEKKTKKK